jgi:hypothetical protein
MPPRWLAILQCSNEAVLQQCKMGLFSIISATRNRLLGITLGYYRGGTVRATPEEYRCLVFAKN